MTRKKTGKGIDTDKNLETGRDKEVIMDIDTDKDIETRRAERQTRT